jgi:hypothetical protein
MTALATWRPATSSSSNKSLPVERSRFRSISRVRTPEQGILLLQCAKVWLLSLTVPGTVG